MEQRDNVSLAANSMYNAHVLTDVGCRSIWEEGKKTGYCVNLKINYYRGMPLSCIDEITLTVDGEEIDPEAMYVETDGKIFPYPNILKDTMSVDHYWRFGELLRVIVRKPGGIDQGVHRVKVVLGLRRSYTPTMIAVCERNLTFA